MALNMLTYTQYDNKQLFYLLLGLLNNIPKATEQPMAIAKDTAVHRIKIHE